MLSAQLKWIDSVHQMANYWSQDVAHIICPQSAKSDFMVAVIIPPDANQNGISSNMTKQPDGIVIVAGDFNETDLRTVLPKFYQHVQFPSRWRNILKHVYTNIPDSYKALQRPYFGQSDLISLLLSPTYS